MKKLLLSVCATFAMGSAFAAGFGLYEASARGVGMGNGLVGSTGDATANYHNPANLTEVTNVTITAGMTLINPFADCKVDGVQQRKMNAGWFPPPHAYIAAPITEGLVFGFGSYCEYGLGTKYAYNWDLKHDTTETTIQQFTLNPNIAYKITEDWSIAVGARMSYFTFENYKNPDLLADYGVPGMVYGRSHLKGDSFNCGYMLATQYKVTDSLKLGLVYRSRINHRVEGDFDMNGKIPPIPGMLPNGGSVKGNGDAEAKVVLPSSVTMGANYDFSDDFRGGVSVTWTEWSTINHIDFSLPVITTPTGTKDPSYKQMLNWHDSWRIGFGFEYDFTDSFTGRIGYSFDFDPSSDVYGTTMLPPGDRHIVGFGIGYKFLDDWRIDLGYNFIMMESETRYIGEGGHTSKFQSDNGYSHIASASLTYSF